MSAKINDPKDPTTWTPEMIRRFNAYRPGGSGAQGGGVMATNKMCACGCGSDNGSCGQFVEVPVTWLPNYMPRTTLDRALMASIQEPPDVPVRPEFLAALEAVARAAEVVVRTQAQAGPVSVAGGDVADRIIDMENVLAALREARR